MTSSSGLLLLGALLGFAPASKALPLVIWSQDSASAFDVSITGSLSSSGESWGGTVVSPSGRWSVGTYQDSPAVFVDWAYNGFEKYISNHGSFFGTFLATGASFSATESFGVTYGGSPFGGGATIEFPYNEEWTGFASTLFTVGNLPLDFDGPDTTDYTTWDYAIRLYAHGPSLKPVPDTAATAGLVGACLAALALIQHRRMR